MHAFPTRRPVTALPLLQPSKAAKYFLGVVDPKIGSAIQEGTGIQCNSNDTITEITRGIRVHFDRFVATLAGGAQEKAQLGLAHSYSRAKVKFNVNRSDNMIIQAIALLDTLDKDLNTFAMRVREWYGWHFPELARIVKDNFVYARVAQFVGARTSLTAERLPELTALVQDDEDVAKAIFEASKTSMGMDISEADLANVSTFTGASQPATRPPARPPADLGGASRAPGPATHAPPPPPLQAGLWG